jgi:hypothetical protein
MPHVMRKPAIASAAKNQASRRRAKSASSSTEKPTRVESGLLVVPGRKLRAIRSVRASGFTQYGLCEYVSARMLCSTVCAAASAKGRR